MIRVLFSRVKIQKLEKLFMGLHTSCRISHPADDAQLMSRQTVGIENKPGKEGSYDSSCHRKSKQIQPLPLSSFLKQDDLRFSSPQNSI